MHKAVEPVVESLDQIASELEWHRLLLHGSLPPARYKHAAVAVGRKMFVTGGTSSQGKLNDIQVFHAEKLTWVSLACQSPSSDQKGMKGEQHDAPCRSCSGHSLVFWEKQFVLVGCQTKSVSKTVTVSSLNLSSRTWSTLSPKGNAPTARTGHTVVQMASMLVLFGGEDMKGHSLNDIYILDLKTLLWLPLETSGTKPSPRRDHCAASYSERYLWIFGGKSKTTYYSDTYCLDFKNMEWAKGKSRGRSPTARAGHSGTVAGNKWYIVGGESRGNEVLNTLAFNLDSHEWVDYANIRPGSPLANDGISVVKIQYKGRTFALAFGGHDTKPSNLIYVMLLPATKDLGSSIGDTLSDTSSARSNSFNSVHSVKNIAKGSVSPPSVRTSNASSGDGSTPESTFSLGEILLRSGREPATDSFHDEQEVATPLENRGRNRGNQAFPSTTTANDKEEGEHQTDEASHDEGHRLPEGAPSTTTAANEVAEEEEEYQTDEASRDERHRSAEGLHSTTTEAIEEEEEYHEAIYDEGHTMSEGVPSTTTTANEEEQENQTDKASLDELRRLPEVGHSTITVVKNEPTEYQTDKASHDERQGLPEELYSTTTTAKGEAAESQTSKASRDERHRLKGRVHPVPKEGKSSSLATKSEDVHEKAGGSFLGFATISRDLQTGPPNGVHEPDTSGDLNERLSLALKLNEDLQNKLVQTHDAKVQLEQDLHASKMNSDVLEQQVLNLVMSKAEGDWQLEEARKKLEELERKLNSPLRLQQDADSKPQSSSREGERPSKPNSLRTKLFEESAFTVDTDTGYETHRRLEEAESKLAALLNSHHLTESKLQTATREKRELSDKAATAMQMMEEARSTNKALRAENLRLEHDLLAVKASLADVQEELQEKQVELAQAKQRNFELQVEMHELSSKFSGS
ncbi:unnamed protein product [Calypogeia fissa]